MCREYSCFIKIWQEHQIPYMKTWVHLWQYLADFFLEWEKFQNKNIEKIKTHVFKFSIFFFFSKFAPFVRYYGKIFYSWARHRWQCGACALHAGYPSNLKYVNYSSINTTNIIKNYTIYLLTGRHVSGIFLAIFRPNKKTRVQVYKMRT